MHPDLPKLVALHEVDARILQLERALAGLDDGTRGKQVLGAARREMDRRNDALKQARVALAEAETALKANETKRAALNKQLYGGSVTSARQAEATEHEIAALKTAAGALETRILELMEAVEQGEAAAKGQATVVVQREKELAATLATYAQESARLGSLKAEAEKERRPAAAEVPPASLAAYDAARRRTKDTGMAALEGVACSGCRMQVPGVAIKGLSNPDELVICDNCGRILYRKN